MISPMAGSAGAFSLDELVTLNQEMAVLVRAGVPLERGLARLGKDLPGRLGKMTDRLAVRIEQGESLSEAVAAEGHALPEVYRAVVEAGVRSGRLAVALESLAATAQRVAELRRVAGLAVLYPLLVVLLAIGMFWFFVSQLSHGFAVVDLPNQRMLTMLAELGASASVWGPVAMGLVVVTTAAWWFGSGRAAAIEHGRSGRHWAWVPSMQKIRFYGQAATFAEVAEMLAKQSVPLSEALRLAGNASGDRLMASAAREVAAAIERGEPVTRKTRGAADLPTLVRLAVQSSKNQATLVQGTHLAAETYRRRATQLVESARWFLPVVLTIGAGATVTLAYALAVFVPYYGILETLAIP